MRKNDGKRIRTSAALVNEVDSDSVHLRSKVSELIECSLVLPPVIGVLPVADEFLNVLKIGAGIPACTFYRMRPPSIPQALLQVAQDLRWDLYFETASAIICHATLALGCHIRPPYDA